ncbi:hypothetical protein [Glycomyces arizonensis]|uniref:hypothetical protein n=1 Tax=Glycomyces arizonensis TaxID=256035 RepID=UPI0012EC40EE|nr:hypothetical protein [Glycomyces arizonensis]
MGELAEKIEADKERVAELAAKIAATKQRLETATGKARHLGAEDIAYNLDSSERELEEAESGRAVLEGSLEKARWQVMAAIHGIGPGAPAKSSGGSSGSSGSSEQGWDVVGPDGEVLSEGADTIPLSLQRGEPSNAELRTTPGPFQKEHENADADKQMNPFARGARSAVRNANDFKKSLDALTKPAFEDMQAGWKPPANDTYPTVGVADSVPNVSVFQPTHAELHNPTGTLVVVAVLVVDWAARGLRRWKGRS